MASVAKRKWTHNGVEKEAWVVRYFDDKGSRRAKQFDLKKDAEGYKRKVEREQHAGLHTPASASVTIEALSRMYSAMREQSVRDGAFAAGSLRIEAIALRCHILPTLGKVHIRDLTPKMIDEWFVQLRNKPGRRGTMQRQTIKMVVKTFRIMMDFAVRREMIAKNPVTDVARWKEHRTGALNVIRTFSDEQAMEVIRLAGERRGEMTFRGVAFIKAAVLLAACCGLRFGEVMGLTWEHIDFDRRRIRVRHSLDARDILRPTKTKAGRRDVPMATVVADALQDWRAFAGENERDLAFRTRSGKAIQPWLFHEGYWRPLLKAAGIEEKVGGQRVHYHALRHFFASKCVNAGMPLPDVAALVGHKSFDVTLMIYAHPIVSDDHRHDMVEALATRYLPTPPPLPQESDISA